MKGAGQTEPVDGIKGKKHTDCEGGNVKSHQIAAQNSGIRIKEYRNQKGSEQNTRRQCRSTAGIGCAELFLHKKSIEKQWEKA